MHRGPPICVEGERVLSPINGFAKIATCCNQSDSAATNSGVLSHRGGRINNPFLKYGVGMVKTGKQSHGRGVKMINMRLAEEEVTA